MRNGLDAEAADPRDFLQGTDGAIRSSSPMETIWLSYSPMSSSLD